VRPERPGNVANRQPFGRRQYLASQRRGRSAEAGSQATAAEAARRCPQHRIPSDIANHSNAVGIADIASLETCEAGECDWQLCWWLRDKF
jgi:hypothetical protein